ncbi:MAG: hypothetical protein ACC642_05345, partial [Pseudomonadales bacterium]
MPKETDWLDELYQQANDQAPPEALDESIQAAARKAVEPWYRNRRRLTSLATAASVVVAALVVYLDPG